MKLVTYLNEGNEQLACYVNGYIYDLEVLHPDLPNSMSMMLNYWDDLLPIAQQAEKAIYEGRITKARGLPVEAVQLIAPVPFPPSVRDAYAFSQHVETARRNRGAAVVPEFEQFPVFYFTNHHSIKGPGEVSCMPDHFDKLDFELECAIVIGRGGRNITAAEADEHIAGLMILNDLSARTLQMDEMKLNLGPAKGKDFATITGPWLVTLDELEQFEIPAREGHTGKSWNLPMTCQVNGVKVSTGNLGDMNWTFAEIIERCAYGANLFAGDIIGSGTVGTGCFLELNGTAKLNNPEAEEQWLQLGDVVELEVEGLGVLTSTMIAEESDFSLLKIKRGKLNV